MAARARKIDVDHPIYALAKAKWKSSGLTDEHAARLHFEPLSADETAALGRGFHKAGALRMPYFDSEGKETEFFRVRYLEALPGFVGVVARPQKYSQPANTLNEVYLPPILDKKWSEVMADPSVTIYVTEGELKAASAATCGLACIGLGGVDMWRASKRLVTLLPQLREVKWKDRETVIVFDSDAAQNLNVVSAQRRLALALLGLGARVAVASLPVAADGSKQGLDDFLVHEGEEALRALLTDAPRFPEADALWELNEEVVYVRDPGLVVERASGRRMEPGAFVAHHYANRHYVETISKENPKGNSTTQKKKPLAPRWLQWEHRFETEHVVYEPGKPQVFDGCWNSWSGWGVAPEKGDVSLWNWLLDHLFKKETGAREWFERWAAYPLQHPGEKMYSAALLWGVETGTGKTLAAYLLADIYGRNSVEIDNEALGASFNAWAEHKQFVIGDEITAGDARIDKDKLKSLVTRQKIRINAKYMPEYVIRDCINYLFTSNSPDALFIDDQDRRYFVHEVVGPPAAQEFYERLDTWRKAGGAAALFHHLLTLPLGSFSPRERAMTTLSKRNMIVSNKSDLGMWVLELREDPTRKLGVLTDRIAENCDLFSATQLLQCYDPQGARKVTAPGLGRELIRAGFRQVNLGSPVRTKLGLVRLYAVRNFPKWIKATPKEIVEHYESQCLDQQKY